MTVDEGTSPRRRRSRSDGDRSRAAIVAAAAELWRRDDGRASLEAIARHAGVGSATLHRHFHGRTALLEAVFKTELDEMVAAADEFETTAPAGQALWPWLASIAHHCTADKALGHLVRGIGNPADFDRASYQRLSQAGQVLLDQAVDAGTIRSDVTIIELLLLINAVSDVASTQHGDPDRLLDLTRYGFAPTPRHGG